MIRKLMTVAAATAMLAAGPVLAAACKDARGKFVKCPAAAASAAHSDSGTTRDKNGKCRIASGPKKGSFSKCK